MVPTKGWVQSVHGVRGPPSRQGTVLEALGLCKEDSIKLGVGAGEVSVDTLR